MSEVWGQAVTSHAYQKRGWKCCRLMPAVTIQPLMTEISKSCRLSSQACSGSSSRRRDQTKTICFQFIIVRRTKGSFRVNNHINVRKIMFFKASELHIDKGILYWCHRQPFAASLINEFINWIISTAEIMHNFNSP